MIRKPVVAGQFYSQSEADLNKQIGSFVVPGLNKEKVLAIVVPHAGYMYSGAIAGAVYSRIEIPKTLIILGPNHTGRGAMAAIMTNGEWQLPAGNVKINSELGKAILAGSSVLEDDADAHLFEHSIEVQIPFIQYFRRDVSIVPIAIMSNDYKSCQDIGEAISDAMKVCQHPITIIASTDMTHYESRDAALKKDYIAIEKILHLDPQGLYNAVRENRISMCGYIATTAALIACNHLNAKNAELVKYMTSGEVSGDFNQVVGYAGLIIK